MVRRPVRPDRHRLLAPVVAPHRGVRRRGRGRGGSHRKRARRVRWGKPGMHHAADRGVADAIYGLILATSIIAVSARYKPDNAAVTAGAPASARPPFLFPPPP